MSQKGKPIVPGMIQRSKNKYSPREIMQLRAFHLVYDLLGEDTYYLHRPTLRFITAIARTADDRMDEALKDDPDIIAKWQAVAKMRNSMDG